MTKRSIPAYSGPTVVAVCPECDRKCNAPDPDVIGWRRDGVKTWCPGCEQMTDKQYWDGPVIAV